MSETPPRRPSGPVVTPTRQPIPRSSSVSKSIDFFESKSRSSTPPPPIPIPVASVPTPRKGSHSGSGPGSPKPAGPRIMTPPSRDGRRLSYRPTEGERRSMDDQRKALGVGSTPQGRRVSESGKDNGVGVAGPSRRRNALTGEEEGKPFPRSISHQGQRSTRSPHSTPPGSRDSSATRRPVLRPRQPSDRPQPTIRVVQPTPRSQPRRRTSAPPESPITPTRTRAFSPVSSSSGSNLDQSSSSRSIRPGTRRTSYHLAKTSSNDGSSAGSISEFGVIGENGESPYLGTMAQFEAQQTTTSTVATPKISIDPGSNQASANNSPYMTQESPRIPNQLNNQTSTSSITTSAASSSSFVSATSPSSPPNIPKRISSVPTSPRVGKRTSSIEATSPKTTPFAGYLPTLGPVVRTISGDSQDDGLDGQRRVSESTARAPSRRPSSPILTPPQSQFTPETSPRRDRKSPGLTIDPSAPLRPPRDSARPSPPVPIKSPLRRLTSQPSTLSERSQKFREGSGESTAATSDSFLTAPLPSPGDGELLLEPGDDVAFPASYSSHEPGEIRFTMLTVPSVYSQDSAPSTAKTTASATGETESLRSARSGSYGWGQQRYSVVSMDGTLGGIELHNRASLPRLRTSITDTGKKLPETPSTTADSANTTSTHSRHVDNGHSPLTPVRSPSMPVMNPIIEAPRKAAALLGVGTATVRQTGMTRSQTTPLGGSFPTPPPVSPNTSSTKRSHLLREIVNTERSYANDLALVRDAYLLRYMRPVSTISTTDSTIAPSEQSRQSSVYTYQTAETKRSSGYEISPNWVAISPTQKSPVDQIQASNYFSPMVASSSTTSLTPQMTRVSTSSRNASGSSSSFGSMGPPVGKPLSPADVRTVFLNLDQLTQAAEEMANAMDKALDEGPVPSVGRDGESGSDRLGEVFVTMMPRYRPLYEFYCARQSTAFVRLTEILADPAHRTHLDECWSHVKPYTHAWNLDSMLIKPIQRITKYPLLFDDLLACTTPVHPDYFNIRNAAAMAKSVAQEIDETKRRKDVVAGVISKKQKSQSNLAPSTVGNKKGLKMFRKDKSTPMSTSTSNSNLDISSGTMELSKSSLSYFKDLVSRVDQYDQCVRKMGKEVILWTAAAKDICMIQDGLVKAWLGLITLDGLEGPDPKMIWFRKVIAGIVNDAWRVLNDKVQDQIMPSLAKLLESGVNPRKVILKRDSRAADYARYLTSIEQKKPLDRTTTLSAQEFIVLHTQLVEELPPFLEGYMRIFDLCICSFATAQAQYHRTIHEKLGGYVREYLDGIKRSPEIVQHGEEKLDLRTGEGVVGNWKKGWTPFADAVDRFQITKPARQVATRLATFQDRPGSHTHILQPSTHSHTRQLSSHSRSNSPLPARPTTPLSPTFIKDQQRKRSTSLMGPPPLPSPSRETNRGFLGIKKTTPTPNSNPSTSNGNKATSPMKAIPRLRSPSPIDPSIRNSFGLPTISPDNGRFGGLGWSPGKHDTNMMRYASESFVRPTSRHSRNGSTSSISSNVGLGIGLGESGFNNLLRRKSSSGTTKSKTSTNSNSNLREPGPRRESEQDRIRDRRRKALSMVSTTDIVHLPPPPTRPAPEYGRNPPVVDAAAGWRGERVLYQCACVAAFDPDEIGRKRYRGLEFLAMVVGDLFDVLHEVGRIDELPNFPYPEIGVENDGVLVAQGENGEIGLIICSFLEPLT